MRCNLSRCLLSAFVLLGSAIAVAGGIDYSHGLSFIEPLKYLPDFQHFDYVNPDAPKGGEMRFPELGTFDSFNSMIDKGRTPWGVTITPEYHNLLYDRLLEEAIDEHASYYGRLADGVWVSEDCREFAFRIREGASWHDGKPLTAEDVLFTFETYRKDGSAGIRTALLELDTIELISPREVYFTIKEDVEANPMLPITVGIYPIMPKHYWAGRDFTKTTIEPPLGSGPYKIGELVLGRHIYYDRVEDYWGKDLPVMRGRYNWARVKYDYFRDNAVMVEAIKGGVLDLQHEYVSKQWFNDYDFPAFEAGLFKKILLDLDRPWGMDCPLVWNLEIERFQDIRVREALWLLHDFEWINRVLMFGFYLHSDSFFFNSEMSASGLPTPEELEVLKPFRGQVPERVFTEPWCSQGTTGYGQSRDNLARALELFEEAGWEIRDGAMTNVETGKPFEIDFIFIAPALLRGVMPFVDALNRIGIQTTARAPELSNWLYRMRSGKFDGGSQQYLPTFIPGLTLRNWFSSASADKEFSQNFINLRSSVVDQLIEKVVVANNPRDFYAATRALDRVLLWNFYVIPTWAQPGFRVVYWDKFGQPENAPRLRREAWLDTWWLDEEKSEHVAKGLAELTGGSH